MRSSRLGIFILLIAAVIFSANCSYYDRIMSRKNLVDGSHAYKERKFAVAEQLFRKAAARDPEGATVEGRTAQLFLARTLHSEFIGDRQNKALAEEAIGEYKKALAVDKDDQSSYKAVASLMENLQQNDEWLKWVTDRANRADILPQNRAEALTSLAAKQNTCAAELSDTDATKKTVKENGVEVYKFTKPANEADFTKLKGCVAEGNKLINEAVALEPDSVKNMANLDVKTLSDQQLKDYSDLLKVFESARSYKASLTVQASRVAEMDGNTAERDRLKAEADQAKTAFTSLSETGRKLQDEMDARRAALEEAANANANKASKK